MTNSLFPTHEDAAAQSKRMMVDEVFEFQGHLTGATMATGALVGGFNARKAGRFEGIRASVGTAPSGGIVTVRLSDGSTNIDVVIADGTTAISNEALSQVFTAGSAWRITLTGTVNATAANLVVTAWGTYTR